MRTDNIPYRPPRWTLLLLAPALAGAAAAAAAASGAPTETSLFLRAAIDGRSHLILDGDSAQWLHFDFAAPGRHFCDVGEPVEPTLLGAAEWYPQWPDVPDCENRGCNCTSDVFTGLDPALPNTPFTATLDLIACRGACTIVEQPTEANGFRVVIEFDDNPIGGEDWYEVVLSVSDCVTTSYCTSTPNSTGLPAHIALGGTASISLNDCWLEASDCPPGEFSLFLYGQGRAQIPVGDGYLCISPFHPGLLRLSQPISLDFQGRATCPVDFAALPVDGVIESGSTWCFQVWYRDSGAGGAGNNFTDAIEVTFCS